MTNKYCRTSSLTKTAVLTATLTIAAATSCIAAGAQSKSPVHKMAHGRTAVKKEAPAKLRLTARQRNAANIILQALSQLRYANPGNAPLKEFSRRLVTAKAVKTKYESNLPHGDLRKAIDKSMQWYSDAEGYWSSSDASKVNDPHGYNIPGNRRTDEMKDGGFMMGASYLDRAKQLLK